MKNKVVKKRSTDPLLALPGDLLDGGGALARVLDHLRELASPHDQFVRSAHFCDLALLHDDHLVVVGDGVQPVSNGYHRGVGELRPDTLLDETIGGHVHTRSGFVQHQEFAVLQQSSS